MENRVTIQNRKYKICQVYFGKRHGWGPNSWEEYVIELREALFVDKIGDDTNYGYYIYHDFCCW